MAMTSLRPYAMVAAASLPSRVTRDRLVVDLRSVSIAVTPAIRSPLSNTVSALPRPRGRLVEAEGVLRHGVSRRREGTGAGAAARLGVLAAPTATGEKLRATQRSEEVRVAVEGHRIRRPDITGREREESGGMHLARMGDEHDAVAVANARAVAHIAPRQGCLAAPGAPCPFEDDTPEVGRLGGRDDGAALGASTVTQVEEPLEEPLAGLGGDGFEPRATTDRDEKEEAPSGGAQIGRQAVDRRQIVERLLAHQRIDLEGQPHGGAGPRGDERPIETAVYPAQGIVAGGLRAVQAE